MTKTETKPKKPAKARPLTPPAERVRKRLEATGDSLAMYCEGGRNYWTFSRAGTPVSARVVKQLEARGMLEPFGQVIDAALPSCLVLKSTPPAAATCGVGGRKIAECNAGLCLDCAPGPMVARIRAGKQALPENWIGPKP